MVSAVVLAAGESKRMGEKKELLPVNGEPMIRTVVTKLLDSRKVDEVVVVLGHRADEVGSALTATASAPARGAPTRFSSSSVTLRSSAPRTSTLW
jgi:CTP:molybdopterin cytidylyltransferase MocA